MYILMLTFINIAIEGFKDTKLPDNHFDVVLGNIPFGEFKVNDSRYNAKKFLIHDYFILSLQNCQKKMRNTVP